MRITRRRADDAVEPGCRTEWCGGRVRSRGKSQPEPCITSAVGAARRPVRSHGLLVLAIVLLVTVARPFLSSWLEVPPPAVARQETQQVLDAPGRRHRSVPDRFRRGAETLCKSGSHCAGAGATRSSVRALEDAGRTLCEAVGFISLNDRRCLDGGLPAFGARPCAASARRRVSSVKHGCRRVRGARIPTRSRSCPDLCEPGEPAGCRFDAATLIEAKGCTPAQLAFAWLTSRHDEVIPIPGTSCLKRLEETSGRQTSASLRRISIGSSMWPRRARRLERGTLRRYCNWSIAERHTPCVVSRSL
jgi:hypothetical protein